MTTRFPNGITTAKNGTLYGNSLVPAPNTTSQYLEDFFNFTAADWTNTIVETGTGSGSVGLVGGAYGQLALITDNNATDSTFTYKTVETASFVSGKYLQYETRFKVDRSDFTNSAIGITNTATSVAAATDGAYFTIALNGAVTFSVEESGTAESVSASATVGNDTFIQLGFEFDGTSVFSVFVDGVKTATLNYTGTLPTALLTPNQGIISNESSVHTMTIDYVNVSQER